jgi:hypothetical protein
MPRAVLLCHSFHAVHRAPPAGAAAALRALSGPMHSPSRHWPVHPTASGGGGYGHAVPTRSTPRPETAKLASAAFAGQSDAKRRRGGRSDRRSQLGRSRCDGEVRHTPCLEGRPGCAECRSACARGRECFVSEGRVFARARVCVCAGGREGGRGTTWQRKRLRGSAHADETLTESEPKPHSE